MEYVFGAESVTEMVYRLSVVEQLTEYNQKVMNELDELIKTNKAKSAELATKKEELKSLKAKLESEKKKELMLILNLLENLCHQFKNS